MTQRRARDSIERLEVVRVAARRTARTRMVQHERRADERDAPGEGSFQC
jgi:hypothetical protein